MSKSIQKKLELALATNDFSELHPLKDPSSWSQLSDDERELLAYLLVKQGEQQLQNGDSKVLDSFALASKAAPFSSFVLFQQALVFASQNQNIRCLIAASEALDKAVKIDPDFIAAWYGWACVLTDMGTFYENPSYYYDADKKFKQAEALCETGQFAENEAPSQSRNSLRPEDFYEQWGICWTKIALLSGEAADFFKALEKFQIATEKEGATKNGRYANEYGNILVQIAFLVGRDELFLEAAEQYKIAVTHFPNEYDGWMNLGCTFQKLFELHGSEEYFLEADVCFERASEIKPENDRCWLRWGDLYAFEGKITRDIERIRASFDKYQNAIACDPENPLILSHLSDAEMLAASYTDNLELLREAEKNISKAVKIQPENPRLWHQFGMCLCEFGRYFSDKRYYELAIVKFQHSLTLDETNPLVHYGMAQGYLSLSEWADDLDTLEKSLSYFKRAFEIQESLPPQFWNDWGVALMKLGELTNSQTDLESAAEKFERAISYKFSESFAKDTEPLKDIELEWLYNYGCVMDFLGDFHEEPAYYERAIQVLTHLLQIDSNFTHAKYNLALAYSHLGELNSDVDSFHKAIALFQTLLEEDNEDEFAWNDWGLTLTNLAVLTFDEIHPEFSQEYFTQAEGKFLHAIALGNTHAFYNLACYYSLTGNLKAALHYLERADLSSALPPTDDIIHDEWLDNLRNDSDFRNFISHLLGRQAKDNNH